MPKQAIYIQHALLELFEAERGVEQSKHEAIDRGDDGRQLAAVAQESGLLKAEDVLRKCDTFEVPTFDTAWAMINEFAPKGDAKARYMARRRWIAAGFPV